tara:strand:- start:97 stop:315 length:219 start_codon:yes stop_codon:yes gene_type:complete
MKYTFKKKNYQIMILGVLVMAAGFILMSGGGAENPNEFSYEIFNLQRLTIAPILILIGLIAQVFAILYRSKN